MPLTDTPPQWSTLPDLLTAEEVAALFRVPTGMVWRQIREGVLPSVRMGRMVRIPKGKLLQFIEGEA